MQDLSQALDLEALEMLASRISPEIFETQSESSRALIKASLLKGTEAALELARRRAREDSAFFTEYVGRLRLTPFQRDWHYLIQGAEGPKKLVLKCPTDFGKTTNIAKYLILHEIGKNPDIRIALICDGVDPAVDRLAAIKSLIESNSEESERLREVFPDLRRERRAGRYAKWTEAKITVERPMIDKDPTVTATGFGGTISGARYDLIILDDIVNAETGLTKAGRRRLRRFIWSTIIGRLTRGGRIVMIGTAFHPEDIYHEALKYDFEAYTYRGEAVPGDEAKDNVFLAEWPERWPPEAIEERKRALPAIEVDRQLRVITAAEGQRFFRPRYLQLARDRGAGLKMPASFTQAERAKAYADEHDCEPKLGYWNDIVAAGVDLSTGTEDGDDTAIFVQRVDVETGKKRPLHLRRGLWGEREILRNILQVLRLFEPAFFAVESDGQQLYIVQGLNDAGMMKAIGARGEDILRLTVIPTYSGGRIKAKTDPLGIRLLAMDFESGKWECPEDPEVERWLDELSLWTPDGHTGDYVSAHYQSEQGLRLGSMAGVYIPKAFREEEQREAAVGY